MLQPALKSRRSGMDCGCVVGAALAALWLLKSPPQQLVDVMNAVKRTYIKPYPSRTMRSLRQHIHVFG